MSFIARQQILLLLAMSPEAAVTPEYLEEAFTEVPTRTVSEAFNWSVSRSKRFGVNFDELSPMIWFMLDTWAKENYLDLNIDENGWIVFTLKPNARIIKSEQ